ncbi:MAG: sugar-binding protein [Verrucomicrobiales bacterium]|nr:sugar-binding protein [Verrucomicrobiales bacterium]
MKFFPHFFLAAVALPVLLHSEAGPEADKDFSHSVTTDRKPWSKREFRNDPNDFQFAIVTDRTGGMRPGIFSGAVSKINEMQPEFVISVGDLIAGGGRLRDEKEIRRQWDEFNGFVEGFEMPFFYLPGNHDVSNAVMDRVWDEMYGVRYYSFVYKDVFFLCLNTQDGEGSRPFLGEPQIAWAQKELKKHPDVRWTMVFIHQPLWLTEEGGRNGEGRKGVLGNSVTGWPEMEVALAGRKHTVYAGHVHRYAKYERNKVNYYTLGTTGGGSALRGGSFGEFDHATWITMTDEGPRMMNLTLDGMLKEDVTTEAIQKFTRGLKFTENFRETFPFQDKVVSLLIENPLETTLAGRLSWLLPATDYWTVSPRRVSVELAPGEKKEIQFQVSHQGDVSTYFPLPRLSAHLHGEESGFHLEKGLYLPLDLTDHVKKYPASTRISAATEAPGIDGVLDEGFYQREPTITRLIPRKADGYSPVQTEAWLSYDEAFIYVGVRCSEPLVRDVLSEVLIRDGDLREDDSIEILFDTNRDQKSFHHFAVNPGGVLYDARERNAKWNSTAKVATSKGDNAWTVEMAIPLAEIQADPSSNKTWGFQMARHRPRLEERESYQWSPTFWYGNTLPTFFGKLELQ